MILRTLFAGAVVTATLVACGGSDDSSFRLAPTMRIGAYHSDLVFDATRQRLYAVSPDATNVQGKIVEVDPAGGQVRDVVAPSDPPPYSFISAKPGTLSLSVHARYLYFTTRSGAASRVDLASGAVDLTVSAPPSMNATVVAVAASRTDDATAYAPIDPVTSTCNAASGW